MPRKQVSAVLDTNIVLSAAIRPQGIPACAVSAGLQGKFLICYSDEIIEEYQEVLSRGRFKLPHKAIETFIADIKKAGKRVVPKMQLSLSPDPDDNKFLEAAQEAAVHYLVTGNKRHFPESHGQTKIVTPREFVTILISAGII
ncbi:MAG: putative toxin-antitoxin system toxin component, PIN family [Acidobacteria bacterium]|nr:putative toxin-antitoxin system toxin component, PIN family [Acidobacteriota bacterium]MBI3656551.1 putative toxin-antitoxin system toxin component, PIN family [Acidobacteriota bacterium]